MTKNAHTANHESECRPDYVARRELLGPYALAGWPRFVGVFQGLDELVADIPDSVYVIVTLIGVRDGAVVAGVS